MRISAEQAKVLLRALNYLFNLADAREQKPAIRILRDMIKKELFVLDRAEFKKGLRQAI